ncbi:MAG: hypothetical protein LBI65_01555 [Candidatus Symbiothrix sp.]|nr:hypothetical protein [Candidatus Symbiothrix sp.]
MKNLFYYAILIAAVCFFGNCSEEDPAQGINVDGIFTNKATIEGDVYLNVNRSSTEVVEYVPEGTLLSFAVDYSSLGVQGSQGRYVKTAPVEADGHYSVELPTRADGTSVPVSITGEQIRLTITTGDGKSKDQIFEIIPAIQSITSNLTYLKKLEYTERETLKESETWTDGIYRVTLKYYNGKEEKSVPENTEVKITVSGDRFVPKRANDLILVEKVRANGLLEIKIPAPSLLNGGLPFRIESAFIGEQVRNVVLNTTVSHVYKLTAAGIIFGGETISGNTLFYQLDALVGEDPERPWTIGTYKAELIYYTGAYDNGSLVRLPVPTGTLLEVVVPGYTSTGADYRFVTAVKNNGTVSFELKAPAATEGQLQFLIKSTSFIAKSVSGSINDNEYLYDDYVFYTPAISGYLYGEGRTVDGGTHSAERGNQLPR